MRSHGALEPLAPISPNVVAVNTRYARASSTKLNAPGVENTMEVVAQDELTISSHASNLTSLEDQTTDDFGKLLLQNARDERRLQDALQGRVRPFSKARPKQRGRLTLADLERSLVEKEASFEQRRRERAAGSFVSFGSPPGSSIGSGASADGDENGSEPSLNIPKEWGRKARKGTDWLRRSLDRADAQPDDEDIIVRRKTGFTGDGTPHAIDWAHTASDIPLPTTEDSPSVQRYARGTPPSIQKRDDAAIPRRGQWDIDEEFTSTSIIASTPAIPRNTRLDDIRRRELETLTEVSGLDILEDRSPDRISSPAQASLSRSAERRRKQSPQQPQPASWSHPAEQQLQLPKRESRRSLYQPARASTEQDEPSPVMIYRGNETPEGLRRTSEQHKRADSHDLLRRLARAASGSPSPARATSTSGGSKDPQNGNDSATNPKKTSTGNDEASVMPGSRSTAEDAIPVPNGAASDNLTQEEDAFDPRTPMPDELLGDDPRTGPGYAKTPVVTGAWVDTPAPATVKRVSLSPRKPRFSPQEGQSAGQVVSQSPVKSSRQRQSLSNTMASGDTAPPQTVQRPTLPPSALAAVLDDAKSQPNTDFFTEAVTYEQELHNFGESTINSLEDLVDGSLAATSVDNTMTMDLPNFPPPDAKPRNAAERQRWKEIEQVARMNKQLKDARHSIRDARVGLKRFENAMLSTDAASQQHNTLDGCDSCGCPGGTSSSLSTTSVLRSLQQMFIVPRNNFSSTSEAGSSKPVLWPFQWRFTWLGLLVVVILTYALVESALCAQFCQPRYAHTMVGFGVDLSAPRTPFVIPTLLTRPLAPFVKPVYRSLKANGVNVLRAYGILSEPEPEVFPWMKGRPVRSEKEESAWQSMLAAAKRTAAPEITRWAQRVVASLEEPASTAVRWAHTAATAAWAGDDEVLGMGADEVL